MSDLETDKFEMQTRLMNEIKRIQEEYENQVQSLLQEKAILQEENVSLEKSVEEKN